MKKEHVIGGLIVLVIVLVVYLILHRRKMLASATLLNSKLNNTSCCCSEKTSTTPVDTLKFPVVDVGTLSDPTISATSTEESPVLEPAVQFTAINYEVPSNELTVLSTFEKALYDDKINVGTNDSTLEYINKLALAGKI